MAGLRSKSIALWVTAFMVFSTLAVLNGVAAEEGPADGRISQPEPQWKVSDYFRYEYKGRSVSYQWQVTFGGSIPGTCDFTGMLDHYEIFTVTSNSNPEYYQLSYSRETWENGTYIFRPQGYQPSTTGNYYLNTKVTSSSPAKWRKADLAQGETTNQVSQTEQYTWTNYGKWVNTTQTETASETAAGGYMAFYKFPLDYGKTWQISGVRQIHRTGTQTEEPDSQGQYDTITYQLTDTYTYTSGTGRTDSQVNTLPQETPAGIFDDCFKIDFNAFYDYTQTGTWTRNNVPQQPVNVNAPGNYWATTRYYSNKAGYICNFNSTQLNNGLRLSDKHYISIPPNYQPFVETLGGQAWATNLPPITVREGEQTGIEFTVIDQDPNDKLNWSVVSIIGSGSNPQGAKLMDETPPFATPNPTESTINQVHSNRLLITAKQPKTVDRDEYTVTVKVDDSRDAGNITFSFRVKVQNVNNKPYVAMPVPDITMRENSTMTCTTWKLTDIFKDQDREAGIVDPLSFTAVVTAGPSVTVNIDQDTGIVTMVVPDYASEQSPMASWDSTIKFTCTDSGSGTPANKLSNNTNAKLRIEHVNHDPMLSDNGTDLAEFGLTWLGDQSDSRLDLNKAFFDPDVRYADDALTYSWSGQKKISVKNNNGRITLTPEIYWNGKETIKFKAMDRLGRSKELRLDCNVMPVNHAPTFCETDMDITWEMEDELTIKEAASPTSTSNNKLLLSIAVFDPDTIYGSDTHSCMWYVNDTNGENIYKSARYSLNDDEYEFRAAFTGAFSASGSPYTVEVLVKDAGGLVARYSWQVKVEDMNRPPAARFDSPVDNKAFEKGRRIYFDAWNSTDPDEAKEGLTFIWNSSLQGLVKQDRGQAGAQFTTNSLKAGRHIITLTVIDSSGGESTTTFTVRVKEPTTTPGFEGVIVVAVVAAAAVFVGWRRRQ
ncbi:MAG: hypothetical protein FJ149_10620 [Euryarchaeota archaeon]|nr:hypothetical protein [Euryarchaeota archaeon]